MALGFYKTDMKKVVDLFNFSTMDIERLQLLQYGTNQSAPIEWKLYKHIVYFVELFYGLCLAPSVSTTENPGCEWQLQMYTQNKD